MTTIITRLALILALTAVQRGPTTVVGWQQAKPALLCLYKEQTLLFCGEYGAGAQRVTLGRCDPCVTHVEVGDRLRLVEMGGRATEATVKDGRVRIALVRR